MDVFRLTALLLALSSGVASQTLHDSHGAADQQDTQAARLPVGAAALPSASAGIPVEGARRSLASAPTGQPTATPTIRPTRRPTRKPTTVTAQPTSAKPTAKPSTAKPTAKPTRKPTVTAQPTSAKPTAKPSTAKPTAKPTRKPTAKPTVAATTPKPTRKPTPKPTPGAGYTIQFVFAPGTTAAIKAIFNTAAARWTSIITADVPDEKAVSYDWFAGYAKTTYKGSVDDVVIAAAVTYIDGPGRILGQAGPVYNRDDSKLTISGIMEFDKDDVAGLIADGSFVDVVLHEMGHVLGIGTYWPTATAACGGKCKPRRRLISTDTSSDSTFTTDSSTSISGAAFYDDDSTGTCYASVKAAELGIDRLQLETDGGPGTACGHWDETQLCTELMTGYLDGPGSPLSVITIGGLQDLGYQVDYTKADAFNPAVCGARRGGTIIWNSDQVLRPTPRVAPARA